MLDRVIQFSLRNRLLVVAIAAFILVYGVIVLSKLPIDVFPDLSQKWISFEAQRLSSLHSYLISDSKLKRLMLDVYYSDPQMQLSEN